jgi:3-phosphoshikimate 1-carboxyvinyltransferase
MKENPVAGHRPPPESRRNFALTAEQLWDAPVAAGPVSAVVAVPGSKSDTNRALVVAALADGTSRLHRPLRARDTQLMRAGLVALGITVDEVAEQGDVTWVVHGAGRARTANEAVVDCGNAGTVARFLPAVATLVQGDVRFVGDARMSERPLGPLLDALRTLGARIDGDRVPLVVHGGGGIRGGDVTVDASSSSQLVSGLLLASPRYDEGVRVRHVGARVPSAPHLEMTVQTLRASGASVDVTPDEWRVAPGALRPIVRSIEPDLSSASAFLAAAAVTGGRVTLTGWPADTAQPGRLLPGLLEAVGCSVGIDADGLTVTGPSRLRGLDVDLHDYGEVAPTLAAVAVLADSPSRLRGIAHLRLQETDRLAALAEELGRLGAHVTVTDDGLDIVPAPLHGGVLDPRADHRLAMAFAVVGLAVPGVRVADIATTGKTVPDFPARWAELLGAVATDQFCDRLTGPA